MSHQTFEQTRLFARSLSLKSESEWILYTEGHYPSKPLLPSFIPKAPYHTFRNKGWISWGDFLGTNQTANYKRTYLTFNEARQHARSLKLTSVRQWLQYCRGAMPELPPKPTTIPTHPSRYYQNSGWISWQDFLNTHTSPTKHRSYLPYDEAKAFVHTLHLQNRDQWRLYIRGHYPQKPPLPPSIPRAPHSTYAKKGWINHTDWLGTANLQSKISFSFHTTSTLAPTH